MAQLCHRTAYDPRVTIEPPEATEAAGPASPTAAPPDGPGGSAPAPVVATEGSRAWRSLQAAVAQAVVGAEGPLRLLTVALLAEGHALIEDVPGVGKTLLASAFARALALDFRRVQGTPDLLPSDVTGTSVLGPSASLAEGGLRLKFVPGPVFTNVLLVDEINRSTPRTQSALLEAMQERQVSIEGETRELPDPFIVLATQNPIEYEGTFSLPEAQLDRFLVRLRIGYPDRAAEARIAARFAAEREPLDRIEPVLDRTALLALRDSARRIHVSPELVDHIVAIVASTRDRPDIELGASPRASVGLYRASQAAALLDGRDFVLPDDIRSIAPAVLTHRLRLSVDSSLHGQTIEGAFAEALAGVPVPVGPQRAAGQPA
jgi:MoxR-like ATPase